MKKVLLLLLVFAAYQARSQSVFGYWYGYANVQTSSSANNYLVELVLQPEKNYVTGILNYYFKNTYRSLQVKGNYNAGTRLLSLYDVPVVYHGSVSNFEVDCMMNLQATLRVAQAGSTLVGAFKSQPDYRYTCADIKLNLTHNADLSKKDSVLKAISEFKETYQVWTPTATDTLVQAQVEPRKVINYVTEKQFTERKTEVENEIEVESDSLEVDVYDNGEIDGDMVSLFYNQQLILYNQKLTHKSIKIGVKLDPSLEANEITMFAENLGLIPPNTALMVIRDGKNVFNIRLSSTLEKNASIKIKRKKDNTKKPG